jgi:hypothetical protein
MTVGKAKTNLQNSSEVQVFKVIVISGNGKVTGTGIKDT